MESKTFAFISIRALGIGIACILLKYLSVQDEYSYENFKEISAKLYRFIANGRDKAGAIFKSKVNTAYLPADVFKRQMTGIAYVADIAGQGVYLFTAGEKTCKEKGRFICAGKFDMFSFSWLKGHAKKALASAGTIAILQRLSGNYFDKQNPVRSIVRIGLIAYSFAFIAMFILCMGLCGLSMLIPAQQTSEIGLQKGGGEPVSWIMGLLSKDFLLLVIMALVVTSPVAWWVMAGWFRLAAFQISIGWLVFMVAGLVAGAIVLAVINFQAIRAAIVTG